MPKVVQVRRGTTSALSSVTGAEGELFVDTDKETLTVHNNYQAGGFPLMREDFNNATDNTLPIAKISRSGATANQVIGVNAAGNGLEYRDGGKLIKSQLAENDNRASVSLTSGLNNPITLWSMMTFNKQRADTHIILKAHIIGHGKYSYPYYGTYCYVNPTGASAFSQFKGSDYVIGAYIGSGKILWMMNMVFTPTQIPNAGNVEFQARYTSTGGSGGDRPFNIWNPNSSDDNRGSQKGSNCLVQEVLF